MKNNNSTASSGVGVTGLLLVAFIILKLCGVINWSWWWVLSPLWITVGICVVFALVCLVIGVIKRIIKGKEIKRRQK